jgi:copper resistance protein D
MTAYVLCVWLHILAATVWIGGMVFFATVMVPVLRRPEVSRRSAPLLRLIGARFRVVGWIALATLAVTGILNLRFRGIDWSVLADSRFWATGFGRTLARKLGLVVFVMFAAGAHDGMSGRRAIEALERAPESDEAKRTRRLASGLGRLALLSSLAILFLAVALVRGFWM